MASIPDKIVQSDTTTRPGWIYRKWEGFGSDTFEQWMPVGLTGGSWNVEHAIERFGKRKCQRPDWCIVRRWGAGNEVYAPVISGPFSTLDGAFAAFKVLTSASVRRRA